MKSRDKEDQGRESNEGKVDIRVTDRRRSYLNDNDDAGSVANAETPRLKPTYVEELEARTQASEQSARDIQTRFEQLKTRLQQETDETRQRLNRAADERAQRAKTDFIAALLPVLDNLERATEAADSGSTLEQVSTGVRQTAESFKSALAATGLEPVPALGELFNPELHEAVETAPADPELDGRVTAEYTRGYRIGDRLLRPARVKVGRATEKAQGAVD
ncbi:MAG: nucleotide exchange factor GrpE [Pyrinomonadaceae bacterium]